MGNGLETMNELKTSLKDAEDQNGENIKLITDLKMQIDAVKGQLELKNVALSEEVQQRLQSINDDGKQTKESVLTVEQSQILHYENHQYMLESMKTGMYEI